MAASSYDSVWRSQPVSDWNPNDASTGHDFLNQIDTQKGNVANAENIYKQQAGQVADSRNTYNDLFNNRTSYNDMYNEARQTAGVDDAKAQYQKSLAAVNGVQSAMTALPSSVNANSGRALTQAQAQAAMANNMNEYNSTLQYWQNQNAGDQNMYQTALSEAQNLAGQNLSEQQYNINTALTNYQAQMDAAQKAYDEIINERNILRTIYGQMFDDEYNHRAQEIEAWATQVSAETQRFVQEQETARNNANLATQNAWNEYVKQKDAQDKADRDAANKASARANDIDAINRVYAQYKSEVSDLTKNANNFGSYLVGENSLFPSMFNGGTAASRGAALKNKGFEDYLYNQSPYLQKILREDYSDLLGMYGIGG